jgi:hypothetical protein
MNGSAPDEAAGGAAVALLLLGAADAVVVLPEPPPERARARSPSGSFDGGSALASAGTSHLARRTHAQNREAIVQHLRGRGDQRQARQLDRFVVDQDALGVVVAVVAGGQFAQVESDVVRREGPRRG